MHSKVTQAIIDTYNDVGVAHVPSVFSQDWVDRMTEVIDDVVGGLRNGTVSFETHESLNDPEFEDRDGYTRVTNLYGHVPEMRQLIDDCDCAEVVADVIGSA